MPDIAEPPQPLPAAPAVEYEHPAAAFPRRQFRLLLILTFINTLLLAAFVCGPAISTFARATWTTWQAKRQLNQQVQQHAAMLRQAERFTAPADEIVYEEHPRDAAKLLNGGAFNTIRTSAHNMVHITPQPWQPPVYRDMSPAVAQLHAAVANKPTPQSGTLLLHSLRAPDGTEHLIWIAITGEQQMRWTDRTEPSKPRRLSVLTERRIRAYAVDKNPSTSKRPLLWLDAHRRLTGLKPVTFQSNTEVLWTKTSTWEHGNVEIHPAGLFRFYAGQIDPKDPSHFTIDYTLDGQRGTIDGYLKNGQQLVFVPRAGRIIDRDHEGDFVWDPFAAPATRPANP